MGTNNNPGYNHKLSGKINLKLDVHMKNKIFAIVMQLVNAKLGGVVQWLVGAGFGAIVAQLAQLGIEIPAESVGEFQLACVGFFTLVIQSVVQWYQNKQAVKLQAALEMPVAKQDGWIGNETIRKAIVVNAQ
jgi:hypothetical protein